MRTRPAQVVALAMLWAAAGEAHVQAQPVIRVEAQTRIELSASRTEDGTRLRLLLLDDLGEGVPDAPIVVRVADSVGQPVLATGGRAVTARDGSVEIALPLLDQQISVEARYTGDAFHEAARALELLDTRRTSVELRFIAPSSATVDLREPALTARVRARTNGDAAGLLVALHDERGEKLGAGTTGDDGVVELVVQRAALGGAGAGKLVAHTPGDVARGAASAELAIVRWLPSQVSLVLESQPRNALRASGLVQVDGRGITGATVGLFTDQGDHIATLRADDHGRYAGTVELRALGERRARVVELQARFESDAPWIGSSRSPTTRLELARPSAHGFFWLAATPALIALLLWWLSRRRAAIAPPIAAKKDAEAGVALAQTRPRAARPQGIACSVLDARTGRAVPGATLELQHAGGQTSTVRGDARGALRVEELAPGSYQLVFSAPGYRPLLAGLESPHRGEWIGAHVRLESLRDAAVRAWSPLTAQLASKAEQAVAITVREAIHRVAPEQAAAHHSFASAALQRAERAAYEESAPTAEDVQRVEHDASELLRSSSARRDPPS